MGPLTPHNAFSHYSSADWSGLPALPSLLSSSSLQFLLVTPDLRANIWQTSCMTRTALMHRHVTEQPAHDCGTLRAVKDTLVVLEDAHRSHVSW